MLRFAVIGTNKITEKFIEAAKKNSDFELTTVYSRTIDRAKYFANKYGAKNYFDNFEQFILSEEYDAVYIASPNLFHASQAISLMQEGKHVLCEKPICSNLEELKLMFETARKNNVVLLEAMRNIFTPAFKKLQEVLKNVGKLRGFNFQYCQYSSRYDNFKKGIIENAFKPELSNGSLMDIGVYCIHPMVTLFGRPDNISSYSVKLSNGIDGLGVAIFDYKEFVGQVSYSKISNLSTESSIQTEDATIYINHIADINKVIVKYNNGVSEIYNFIEEENNMSYEIDKFINMVENNNVENKYINASLIKMEVLDNISK